MTVRRTTDERIARARAVVVSRDGDGRVTQALLDKLAEAARAAQPEHSKDTRAIERKATIARMTREGATVRQIADAIGVSVNWVYKVRADLGLGRSR